MKKTSTVRENGNMIFKGRLARIDPELLGPVRHRSA
jgi:hypothetical protein